MKIDVEPQGEIPPELKNDEWKEFSVFHRGDAEKKKLTN
jgi:hypothetical protein